MADMHVTLELLRAIARGERNPGDLSSVIDPHLRTLCPVCAEALDAFDRERQESGKPLALDYGEAYEWAMEKARRAAGEFDREKAVAKPRLAKLLALPAEDRLMAIERSDTDLRGPMLAELLLEESLSYLPGRPQDAYGMAQLAKAVLFKSDLTPISTELYARTLAHLANARRATGALREAADLFDHARFFLRLEGGGDRLLRAEVDALEGSLRRAQRRLTEAADLLRRAVIVYRLEQRPTAAAEVLLCLSMALREQGEIGKALGAAEEALQIIHRKRQPRLFLHGQHNRAWLLSDDGRHYEARQIFEASLDLYQGFSDPWTQLRRLWLEGKIARGLGELETAEQAFLAVRDGFLHEGVGFDAALASLDLALLYLDQGKTVEVKRLAEEMVPVFEAQDVHREAAAALLLFQEAARREEATVAFVREVFTFLEAARMDPELKFGRPEAALDAGLGGRGQVFRGARAGGH